MSSLSSSDERNDVHTTKRRHSGVVQTTKRRQVPITSSKLSASGSQHKKRKLSDPCQYIDDTVVSQYFEQYKDNDDDFVDVSPYYVCELNDVDVVKMNANENLKVPFKFL